MRRRLNSASVSILVLACAASPVPAGQSERVVPDAGPGTTVRRQAYLMGTLCTIEGIHDSRARGLQAIEAGLAAIRQDEALLSTWRDDTSLALLNAGRAGAPQPVPVALARLLERAAGLWQETGGAFDPAIAALVKAWGLRGAARTPTEVELSAARGRSGMGHVRIDQQELTVTLATPGLGFDAGAFGKGAGLADAGAALAAAGLRAWWIDFGGQVLIAPDGPEREIAVAHPDHRERPAVWLRLRGLSAATSGDSQRPGHILDPRSGRPAADFGSVTVLSSDPLRADALSTALFVLGPDQGLDLARRLPDAEALFIVRQDGGWALRATAGATALLVRRDLSPPAGGPASSERTSGPEPRLGRAGPAVRGPVHNPPSAPRPVSATESPR